MIRTYRCPACGREIQWPAESWDWTCLLCPCPMEPVEGVDVEEEAK